jgi:uncharacterized protein (DUF1697 family)
MGSFVALLRGINVGAHRRVPMAELRELVSGLGHAAVRTHLASGNVVFTVPDGRRTAHSIETELREALERTFEPGIEVLVRPGGDLSRVAAAGHPLQRPGDDPRFLHAVFLDGRVAAADVAQLARRDWRGDGLAGGGSELFVRYASGSHRSPLTLDRLERELGVTGTARNWNTVTRLAEMVRDDA